MILARDALGPSHRKTDQHPQDTSPGLQMSLGQLLETNRLVWPRLHQAEYITCLGREGTASRTTQDAGAVRLCTASSRASTRSHCPPDDNCAVLSCPPSLTKAYDPVIMGKQLLEIRCHPHQDAFEAFITIAAF